MQLRCSLKSDIIMETKYTLLKCVLAFVEVEKPSVIEFEYWAKEAEIAAALESINMFCVLLSLQLMPKGFVLLKVIFKNVEFC